MSNKVLFVDFDGVLHPTHHGSALLSQLPLSGLVKNEFLMARRCRMNTETIRLAEAFAREVHEGQFRKGEAQEPYAVH
jgi:hypothetical protein